MTALVDETLVRFLAQTALLLTVARALGYVARRFRQPAVVGELAAGLVLGPSILGALAPSAAERVFPDGGLDLATAGLAGLGVLFVVLTAGYEVDTRLVRRLIRATAAVPVGAFVVPLVVGAGVALLLPDTFVAEGTTRLLAAGFVGLALALSALPVIARILRDTGVLRRDIGQVTMVSAMADDVVGWLFLGVLLGVAETGTASAGDVLGPVVAVGALALVVFTVGQRVLDLALRASFRLTEGIAGAFTTTVVALLVGAGAAEAAGVHAILGAFLVGVALRRSPLRRPEVAHAVELIGTGFLGPIFFASVGMSLDLGTLASPAAAAWTLALLGVAVATKLAGAWLGARLSSLDTASAVAVGAGLVARGAVGVVVAAVALEAGVFTDTAFTAIVAIAIATSAVTPPLLAWATRRVDTGSVEADRLQREALFGESLLVNARRVLLPTRGGRHSRLAARIVDLSLDTDAAITVVSVHQDDELSAKDAVSEVAELFGHRRVGQLVREDARPARIVADEARYGYDLLVLGASGDLQTPAQLSDHLGELLVSTGLPVLLVRAAPGLEEGLVFHRVLTAATGTRVGRAAEEVASVLATRTGADLDIVHVISRADRMMHAVWSGRPDQHSAARTLLTRSVASAARFGSAATGVTRVGASAHEQVLDAAVERRADTIVVGAQVVSIDGRPFLGHGVEYLLEHATQTLIVVAYPS